MPKAKKELSPKEIAWRVFLEDYDDDEIPKRFERFTRDQERMKEEFNPRAQSFNEMLEKKQRLESLLMETIKAGHFDRDSSLLKEINDLEKEIESLNGALGELQAMIKKNGDLIKKYEDWSEKKLFEHWRYLKAFDSEVQEWAGFKAKYYKVF